MENETEKIFAEQLGKLPQEVVTFISSTSWDTDLDEIGELYNLTPDEILAFKREVTLVLAGLVHPDALSQMLSEEVGIKGAVLEALVANVEKKIFTPIRPALITFFEKEASEHTEEIPVISTSAPGAKIVLEKSMDVAPDNLPTTADEAELFLPSLQPKTAPIDEKEEEPLGHPFEEKMKKVFTAGQQDMNEFVINTPTPQTTKTSFPKSGDPYREPIE